MDSEVKIFPTFDLVFNQILRLNGYLLWRMLIITTSSLNVDVKNSFKIKTQVEPHLTLIHKDLDQSLITAQVSSTDLTLCWLGLCHN